MCVQLIMSYAASSYFSSPCRTILQLLNAQLHTVLTRFPRSECELEFNVQGQCSRRGPLQPQSDGVCRGFDSTGVCHRLEETLFRVLSQEKCRGLANTEELCALYVGLSVDSILQETMLLRDVARACTPGLWPILINMFNAHFAHFATGSLHVQCASCHLYDDVMPFARV